MFFTYTAAHGLPASGVEALAEDTAGNLWIGTDGRGAAKLVWKTFLTYTADDGLGGTQIDSIFEDAGKLCVVTRRGVTDLYLNEFDGSRFRATRVNLPAGTKLLNWGPRKQTMVHDGAGDWWIGTSDGLFRYSGVSRIPTWPADFRLPGTRSATGCPRDRWYAFSEIPPVASGSAPPETGIISRGGIVMTGPFTAMRKGCHGSRLPAFHYSPKTDRAGFG